MRKNTDKLVFMYSGQGSQYFHMGKELYGKDDVFKRNMDLCDEILRPMLGQSLVNVIYSDSNKLRTFDDILLTHPALHSFGYSLTQVLIDKGIRPEGVLGYSLGEYIAATISGLISLEDGLGLVTEQAKCLKLKCSLGGMLSILASVKDYEHNPNLYAKSTLAGINYDNNFVVSGLKSELISIQDRLQKRSIISFLLPVNYGFHSSAIDSIESDFRKYVASLNEKSGNMPSYSSARVSEIVKSDEQYYWDVVRSKIKFRELIAMLKEKHHFTFVDLSPTATFSAFFKHGFGNDIRHHFAVNQFGKNISTIHKLVSDLI